MDYEISGVMSGMVGVTSRGSYARGDQKVSREFYLENSPRLTGGPGQNLVNAQRRPVTAVNLKTMEMKEFSSTSVFAKEALGYVKMTDLVTYHLRNVSVFSEGWIAWYTGRTPLTKEELEQKAQTWLEDQKKKKKKGKPA